MFAVERWNDHVKGQDDAGRRDASRTPQCAAPTRAQLPPAPAGSAARGVGWLMNPSENLILVTAY
jgi:hypothetical protein